MPENRRTSLLIRCSIEDAQMIRTEAATQHRNVNGYLLYVLERSMWIEQRFLAGYSGAVQTPAIPRSVSRKAIHLRCTIDEADRIRNAAQTRFLSISNFVVFSLHRHWRAAEKVRNS